MRAEIDARREVRETVIAAIAERFVEIDFAARGLDAEIYPPPPAAELTLERAIHLAELARPAPAEVELRADAGPEAAHVDKIEIVDSEPDGREIILGHKGRLRIVPVREASRLKDDRVAVAAAELKSEPAVQIDRLAFV